ncbi:MAG: ABC transporter permease [Proteobacteria bacterium]|nr:ABC transporter permease [Pseudomonadota bacterium]
MVPLSYNVRSLFVRRATTLATMAGIALVVFVLASALMLTNGIKKTLDSTGSPDRAFVLRMGSDAELSSNIEAPSAKLAMDAPGVKKSAQGPMAVAELIVVAALDKTGTRGQVSNVQIRGVSDDVFAFRPEVRIIDGRPARPGTDEVIVGQRIRGRFDGVELGASFELKKNRPVTVVGVFEAGGSAFESEIWADVDTLRTSFGRENLFSSVTVQLESATSFDAFKAQVESDKRLGLDVVRESVYYEKQSGGTATFIMVTGIIISVFFAIGAMIGAMITMYGAVSQRRREIGTLRALGFSRLSILLSFLFESLVLAVLGGAIGVAAALPMGMVELSMMNFMTWSEMVFTFDPTSSVIVTALIFGSVMGIIGGFFPALRAAMTSPIEAMRD